MGTRWCVHSVTCQMSSEGVCNRENRRTVCLVLDKRRQVSMPFTRNRSLSVEVIVRLVPLQPPMVEE